MSFYRFLTSDLSNGSGTVVSGGGWSGSAATALDMNALDITDVKEITAQDLYLTNPKNIITANVLYYDTNFKSVSYGAKPGAKFVATADDDLDMATNNITNAGTITGSGALTVTSLAGATTGNVLYYDSGNGAITYGAAPSSTWVGTATSDLSMGRFNITNVGNQAGSINLQNGVVLVGTAQSVGTNAVKLGFGGGSAGYHGVLIGQGGYSGNYGVSIGPGGYSEGNSVAIGSNTRAKEYTISLGTDAQSLGTSIKQVHIGNSAQSDVSGSVCVGSTSKVLHNAAGASQAGVSVGFGAVTQDGGVSIGSQVVSKIFGTSIGYNAKSSAVNNICINATGIDNTAAGFGTTASAFYVMPIRSTAPGAGFYPLAYNPTTGEIVYDSGAGYT